MRPQRIIPDSNLKVNFRSDHVTFYGGMIAKDGRFEFGHIQASVNEPTRRKHRAGSGSLPVPYLPRMLTVHNNTLTVDTPKKRALFKKNLVVEGTESNHRFRETTSYHPETDETTFTTGLLETFGDGIILNDTRTEHNISGLRRFTRARRQAILLRTINATTAIFEQIAKGEIQPQIAGGRRARV